MYRSNPYQQERGRVLVELKAKQVSPDSTNTAGTEDVAEDCQYYEAIPIRMKVQCVGGGWVWVSIFQAKV